MNIDFSVRPDTATLRLEIPIEAWEGKIDPRIAEMFNEFALDWSDGRYPFSSEMLMHGLYECLKQATEMLIHKDMHDKYGNEQVPDVDGKGSTARWYLESLKEKREVPSIAFDKLKVSLQQ